MHHQPVANGLQNLHQNQQQHHCDDHHVRLKTLVAEADSQVAQAAAAVVAAKAEAAQSPGGQAPWEGDTDPVVAQALAILPHLGHLPGWIVGLWLVCAGWRLQVLRMRARRVPGLIDDAKDVLLALFDADVEYSADALEGIYDDLKKVSAQVLEGSITDTYAQEVLADIAWQENLNGRVRRNMLDTRRAVSFMMRSKMLDAEQFGDTHDGVLAG